MAGHDLAITIDPATAALIVEGLADAPATVRARFAALAGPGTALLCAKPPTVLLPPVLPDAALADRPGVQVAGYYHNSLIEGPGRRSSALFAGCPIRCRGCAVPHLQAPTAGTRVPVDVLADVLLDPVARRDGVSILGGEPFFQPDGLLALVEALRQRGCPHILGYSGWTYEALQRRAARAPAIGAVLARLDILIDGPFVAALADQGGPWTGSGNQRVIDLVATRRTGQVVVLDPRGVPAAPREPPPDAGC